MTITDPDDMDLQAALRHYADCLTVVDNAVEADVVIRLMRDAADCIDELEERR